MAELYRVERPAGINRYREEAQEDPQSWQDSFNVMFQHGITKKVEGYEEGLGQTLVDPEILVPLRDDDGLYYWWAYVGVDPSIPSQFKFYRITNTLEHLEVTPDVQELPTNGIDYKWTGDTINGVPYLTYGIPYLYDQVDSKFKAFENIPRHPIGVPDDVDFDPNGGDPRVRFRVIRTYKNFLIGMNFDTDSYAGYFDGDETVDPPQYWGPWDDDIHQNAVWWSHSVIGKDIDPSWEDANSLRYSGWNFLGGSGGNIVDGKTMRDSFIIYRERSVWQMSYIGGVQIFAFKEIFNDVGALGLDCVLEVDGEHMVVGKSDIYRHNGVRKQTIADGIIRREFFDTVHPLYSENVFVTADYKNKEAWICIPTADQDELLQEQGLDQTKYAGSCNLAYVYNWVELTWSKKEIPWLTGSTYTILSVNNSDESWDAIEEGGPVGQDGLAVPPYPANSTWEQTTDIWMDSFFKYNPSDWGIASTSRSQKIFTSTKVPTREPLEGSGDLEPLNFEGSVKKTYMDMGERLITKYVSRIYPLVRYGVVQVKMGYSMKLDGGITWVDLGLFDSENDEHISCRITGRFVHVEFIIPESSRAEIRGYHVEFDFIGRR